MGTNKEQVQRQVREAGDLKQQFTLMEYIKTFAVESQSRKMIIIKKK